MKKKYTYVPCKSCAWSLQNHPTRDWEEHPCEKCKNTRQVINPEELVCNLCGECLCPLGTMSEQYPHGLVDAKVTGGYESYHLFDLTTYVFSFCEECLRKLFNQCKIKPIIYDATTSGPGVLEFEWKQDQDSYEERLWMDSDAPHQAYLNKKCNQRKDCPYDAEYSLFSDWGDEGLIFTEQTACEKHKPNYPSSSYIIKPYISPNLRVFT